MPAYLQHFGALIIPFKVNAISEATDPVKSYEYISQGKAVVSAAMPELFPMQTTSTSPRTMPTSWQVRSSRLIRWIPDPPPRMAPGAGEYLGRAGQGGIEEGIVPHAPFGSAYYRHLQTTYEYDRLLSRKLFFRTTSGRTSN